MSQDKMSGFDKNRLRTPLIAVNLILSAFLPVILKLSQSGENQFMTVCFYVLISLNLTRLAMFPYKKYGIRTFLAVTVLTVFYGYICFLLVPPTKTFHIPDFNPSIPGPELKQK